MSYQHGKKKTFLSIDRDHSSGQVILTYPRKYWGEANGRAHHLVKYMEYENGSPALRWFNYLGLAAASDMQWNATEGRPIPRSEADLIATATMEFDWLDCPDLMQSDSITRPSMVAEDLSVVPFDGGHKPSGRAPADDDSLATAQASTGNTANSPTDPPLASTAILGSSALAPVNVDDDDLASKVDTVASKADTVDSPITPAALAILPTHTKLKPVDIDADDLASMIDTVDGPSDSSSSDSSSDSSISEDPPDDPQEDPMDYHKIIYSGNYYVDPPDDMETERPEAAPDPVMADANLLNNSTTPLLSVGDPQQTLGDGPPTAPPRNPPTRVLLRQARASGCNSPQLVPQDPPLPAPAITLASATYTNISPNEAPVPSTLPMPLLGDGTGNGGTLSHPPHTHNTQHHHPKVTTYPGFYQSPPDNTIPLHRRAADFTHITYNRNNSPYSTPNFSE